jgi:hypothetical protein
MSVNIGLFPSDYKDASSFYRCLGPFGELRRRYRKEINVSFLNEVTWATCSMIDVAVLQRPHLERHLRMAEVFVENRIPLWVDWDDQVFKVPSWNPNHKHYENPITRKVISQTLAMADVVTVSTAALAEEIAPLNQNIIVIPNALNTRLLGPNVPARPEGRDLIFWRGSRTHREDLNVAARAIVAISEDFPELTFAFQGAEPWFGNMMDDRRVFNIEALDVIEYHRFLEKVRPSICVFPLVDCDFNHSKSNCGWLEASWAGAATLAPNWQEWQQPGVTNYRYAEDFEQQLRHMIATRRTTGLDMARASWEHIERHLTIDNVNQQRMEVLEGIIDGTIAHPARGFAGRRLSGDDVSKLLRVPV